jgi:hypothetical protein
MHRVEMRLPAGDAGISEEGDPESGLVEEETVTSLAVLAGDSP